MNTVMIAEVKVKEEGMVLYFAINPDDLDKPFIFGGYGIDPSSPKWGAASTFGLDEIDSIDGAMFCDWRATLNQMGCGEWVIPILEAAIDTGNQKDAVETILRQKSLI